MKTIDDLLAHPIREHVLTMIMESSPTSAVEVSKEIGISLGTVSYHVRELHEAGIITVQATRQRRGATETFYVGPPKDRLDEIKIALDAKIAGAQRLLISIQREIG